MGAAQTGKSVFLDSAASAPWSETQADGLCTQREFFPLLLRSGLSGVKTPLGAQTGKSVFLGSRDGGKKKQ
jgi:hypothetical protein